MWPKTPIRPRHPRRGAAATVARLAMGLATVARLAMGLATVEFLAMVYEPARVNTVGECVKVPTVS